MARVRLTTALKFVALCSLTLNLIQTASAQSDVQAVAFLQRALSSQLGRATLQDIQLTGTAVLHLGIDQRGPVSLQADAAGHSKVVLDLDGGQRTEYSSGYGEEPACTWTGTDGKVHDVQIHNCMAGKAWFLPISSLSAAQLQGLQILTYSGPDKSNGASVEHLSSKKVVLKQKTAIANVIQELSNQDIYIDSVSFLPTSLKYFTHPDNDLKVNILVEINFSDYRDVGGVKVPFHIEKSLNGSTSLEITIESAVFNTGVPTKQ
ncbi:MAG: hypothetical protein JWO13_2005 [Acidobacteriales bacterium]|nr:hypothetical protein [Terriglobales bacterium]